MGHDSGINISGLELEANASETVEDMTAVLSFHC
jgi:hypothetical protein